MNHPRHEQRAMNEISPTWTMNNKWIIPGMSNEECCENKYGCGYMWWMCAQVNGCEYMSMAVCTCEWLCVHANGWSALRTLAKLTSGVYSLMAELHKEDPGHASNSTQGTVPSFSTFRGMGRRHWTTHSRALFQRHLFCLHNVWLEQRFVHMCMFHTGFPSHHVHPFACTTPQIISSIGQDRTSTPYMTVYLVISLPTIPYMHRMYGSGQP
jgi:hypothetical protein